MKLKKKADRTCLQMMRDPCEALTVDLGVGALAWIYDVHFDEERPSRAMQMPPAANPA